MFYGISVSSTVTIFDQFFFSSQREKSRMNWYWRRIYNKMSLFLDVLLPFFLTRNNFYYKPVTSVFNFKLVRNRLIRSYRKIYRRNHHTIERVEFLAKFVDHVLIYRLAHSLRRVQKRPREKTFQKSTAPPHRHLRALIMHSPWYLGGHIVSWWKPRMVHHQRDCLVLTQGLWSS